MDRDVRLSEDFRHALRRLAKAVVVITSCYQDQRFAMAATAVSELSLEPPSLLICVNRSASLHMPLAKGAHYCVNILDKEQESLARLCSGAAKGEARFAEGMWDASALGVPYLVDAQANFVCENADSFSYGTHCVFVGKVIQAMTHGPVDPLIYADGQYGRINLTGSARSA